MTTTTASSPPRPPLHVAILPYPGRGHINPIITFCKSLLSHEPNQHLQLTIILTEEWLTLLGSEVPLSGATFATIPNVIPGESARGSDHAGFLKAVLTQMEAPVERVLDGLVPQVGLIIADAFLPWAVRVGRLRGVPVGSFWPAAASLFSVFLHHELIVKSPRYPIDLSGMPDDQVDNIPGIPPMRLTDLPDCFRSHKQRVLDVIIQVMSMASQADFIIFRTIYNLESLALDALMTTIFPSSPIVYPIGPAIPFSKLEPRAQIPSINGQNEPDYIQWLDTHAKNSILYVSLGSYLFASKAQTEELITGLAASGVPFLWVAREEVQWLEGRCGEKGMVVRWCDQMRVLCHGSVGGFLTHCGWNSCLESAFAGVPMLTFPLTADQPLNAKMVVENWRIGWRLKGAIAEIVKKFMDLGSKEREELERKCKKVKEMVWAEVGEGSSTQSNIDRFLFHILQHSRC